MKKLTVLSSSLLLSISLLLAQAPEKGTVIDIDGNVYQTVEIGKYEWMAENLKTITCNNGKRMRNVPGSIDWSGLTSCAYCWYNNNENTADTFGVLYNITFYQVIFDFHHFST